jgi:thiol-disulfide isomerase/thioredoxin
MPKAKNNYMKTILAALAIFLTVNLSAQVTITGVVKNLDDSTFYIVEQGFDNINRTAWRGNKIKVSIDSTGHFKATIPEKAIDYWILKWKNGHQFFDLVKGHDLEVVADFSRETPFTAIGSHADDFNYQVYESDNMDENLQKRYDRIKKKDNIDSILLRRKEYAAFKRQLLTKYKSTHKMSDAYYKWLYSKYTYEPYDRTIVENIDNQDSLDDKAFYALFENGVNDDYAALNTIEYNDLIRFYMYRKFQQAKVDTSSRNAFFNFALGNTLKGNTKDVFLTRIVASHFKVPDSIYLPLFNQYNKVVKNKMLKQYVIEKRNEFWNPSPAKGGYISKASSLKEIFGKYKGNVIYVDFWASWCAPCRSQMMGGDTLKHKLAGKNVVFLYLGCRDSEAAWLKARNEMEVKGEHYLLSPKLMKEAEDLFGIDGIPHYAIIDKDGKIIIKNADNPFVAYEQLIQVLEK